MTATKKPKDTRTAKQKRRAIDQEELRRYLAEQQHIVHIHEICDELNDESVAMDSITVQRKSKVIDTKLRLLNKYLPDLKSVEIESGEKGFSINVVAFNEQQQGSNE